MMDTVENLNFLVIEDNVGDYIIIEDLIFDNFKNHSIKHVSTFSEAIKVFNQKENFDIILLDLSLPDIRGELLVKNVLELCSETPVIVLTGYTDKSFGLKSLTLGVSDYLLKDELSAEHLLKSVEYSIERKKISDRLKVSEDMYRTLFELSPLPMWVFDLESLAFLNVNEAAEKYYGFSKKEFMSMTVKDIRQVEELPKLKKALQIVSENEDNFYNGRFTHKKKNGEIVEVESQSNVIEYNHTKAGLVVAKDITERLTYIKEIERQNNLLKDIAWTQSHEVRAPLSKIMGIVDQLTEDHSNISPEQETFFKMLRKSAMELDKIVREINDKSEML